MPVWFDTEEDLDAAVADLAAMSPAARAVLSRAIETQGHRVTKVSPSATALEDMGLLFIRETSFHDTSATLYPSLWGEEALDQFELRAEARAREAKAKPSRRGKPAPPVPVNDPGPRP